MTDLRAAAQQALEALKAIDEDPHGTHSFPALSNDAITALKAALAQQEQGPHWLTKELMADYLDMVAEAIENDSSETLRHKAHWMRNRGEV
jgi:hypothetical protein